MRYLNPESSTSHPESLSEARAARTPAIVLVAVAWLAGCATSLENSTQASFHDAERQQRLTSAHSRPATAQAAAARRPRTQRAERFDGALEGYVAYALENSPALRAQFEEWRAKNERIALARRLPEPTFTYAFFVRSVETRVGPQRHRFGISQQIPWPSRLSAAADSASYAAQSEQQKLEALALAIAERVARAYYDLWLIGRTRQVLTDQEAVLQQFSLIARSRVEVGQSTLADLNQIDLTRSRLADRVSGLREAELSAQSRLRAALGASPAANLPITGSPPDPALPAETGAQLSQAAANHPRIEALTLMAESKSEAARSAEAERYPGFVVGAEYIETGKSDMTPAPADSGKDPIVVSLSVKLPIWGSTYSAAEAEARAESAAFRARISAARDEARAAVEQTLSELRDAVRRTKLYEKTLVPQAEAVFESVLGAYQAERSTLASALMAEKDLLELELARFTARADFAHAWARLEELVGRSVHPKETR